MQIHKMGGNALYTIGAENLDVFEITFDTWLCPRESFDPVFPFAKAAAELSGASLRIVDEFFEYEIANEDFCAVFCWNGGFTIMTYVKRENERGFAYEALKEACNSINSELDL